MTHSHVWHDSFICVTWLVHKCDTTYSYMWYDPFICATSRIHLCNPMGWLRWVGCLKIYVSLQNIGLFCRSLLQKSPIFLSILLIVATPYVFSHVECATIRSTHTTTNTNTHLLSHTRALSHTQISRPQKKQSLRKKSRYARRAKRSIRCHDSFICDMTHSNVTRLI